MSNDEIELIGADVFGLTKRPCDHQSLWFSLHGNFDKRKSDQGEYSLLRSHDHKSSCVLCETVDFCFPECHYKTIVLIMVLTIDRNHRAPVSPD